MDPVWSLPKFLEALSNPPFDPLGEATLLDATIKNLFLIATASGQRGSSFHAFCVTPGHIRWERRGVRLILTPNFLAKNQSAFFGFGGDFT